MPEKFQSYDDFFAFYGQWLALFGGTFTQDIVGLYGGEDHVIMLVHETGRRGDAVFDNQAVYVITMRDGQWACLETYDRDRAANERFWAAVGGPAALHAVCPRPDTRRTRLLGTRVRRTDGVSWCRSGRSGRRRAPSRSPARGRRASGHRWRHLRTC